MSESYYVELIHCKTPEEVYATVRSWSSNLSDHEHLVRSTILDIQADIERVLKQVLYHTLVDTIFHPYDDDAQYQRGCKQLEEMVIGSNFATVYRLLKPALDAFPSPDLDSIQPINELRNRAAHSGDLSKIVYKGRNPFTDADALAQLFFDGWAARQELRHFYERMVHDPREIAKLHAKFFQENYDKVQSHPQDQP